MAKSKLFNLCIVFTFLQVILNAQSTRYEAEAGTLSGSLTIQNSIAGFSGGGYAGRFENDGDKLTLSFSLPQAGRFNIYIGYAAPYGEKINTVNINGNTVDVTFPSSSAFREIPVLKAGLYSGNNSISIIKSWGWFLVDYIRIEPNTDPETTFSLPYDLATPEPALSSRRLFTYLSDKFTKKIHAGAMSLNAVEEAQWIFTQTGKYPALIGLDFMNHTRDWNWYDKSIVVREANGWYAKNGMAAICWHWRDPSRLTDEFYTNKTSFDVSKVSDPLSAEYQAMLGDIDMIAPYLRQLESEGTPVLFRPLHEASGGWFWWGAKGAGPCKLLWKLMFDRLVKYHGLKNLIWIWTTDTKAGCLDWYPGDEYVDILGMDIYASNGDFGSQVLSFEAVKEIFGGKKLITLSENGPVPDPDKLVADRSGWSWFMPWYGDFIRNGVVNPLAHWQKVMDHEYVITLDEMPDLKTYPLKAEIPQGFFLADWEPRTTTNPDFTDVLQISDEATVAVTVDITDTVTRISKYLFGDNANLWTGTMSDNKTLMKNIAAREPGVIRGPGGSISDVFFWNRNAEQRPGDVPQTLPGSSEVNWPWYGDRPHSWENWTMDVDSFYTILGKTRSTGMITVNYGYARYGTSVNPVANAAHLAAEWVRYDKGRTRFWEIGNEVFGGWEAGYRIDRSLNKDGQPEVINPTLYGQHCSIFIDSMKAAASLTGYDIRIGVVMAEASSTNSAWNAAVAAQVGSKADFYVVHSYFTPYGANSNVETILNSYVNTGSYNTYVWNTVVSTGKPKLPVALTEYNIFAGGSNQPVSHINGMHAVLVTGEAMKTGYGAAVRWDLANGWDNGNDHGMFSYNEPGIPNYTPHPAFFHLYYMRRFCGDVLLNSSITGATGLVVTPTAFSSGHIGASIVNTARLHKIMRLNIRNFKSGDRYYTYTLTGTPGEEFSRKVFVNGAGGTLAAGGPENYETIKAEARQIIDEIRIMVPPLSAVYVLVEPGTRELTVNEDVSVNKTEYPELLKLSPNPAKDWFIVETIPPDIFAIDIMDLNGRQIYSMTGNFPETSLRIDTDISPGLYIVVFRSRKYNVVRKLVIR